MSVEKSWRDQTLNQLKNIVNTTLQTIPVNVYLFGSWARHEEKRTSDIDIALYSKEEIPQKTLVNLYDRIEESTIPYKVDVVDLKDVDSRFIEKVLEEGIVWRDYANESKSQTKP